LVLKAGKTGRVVNIKKGQFMAPDQMKAIAEKVYSTENNKVIITERGYSFGYHNLVVDMRAFPLLRNDDLPVVFDATHSLQLPGKDGETTGGMRDMIPYLARASVACGIDGIFMEVHDCPQCALCDSSNMISIETFKNLIPTLIDINTITKKVAF
jgi:2-dehydro-3-deoxyphosphooctonate aldolase (KDO 8-P synthase)